MKNLKVKNILFSLLAMMAVAFFMTSCDDDLVEDCCEILGHEFEAGPSTPGNCFNNSVYQVTTTNAKTVQYSVTQTQYIDDDNINTFTLYQYAHSLPNTSCTNSVIAIPYSVLDLPGTNIINSNMWIYDQVDAVCDHMSDSYIVEESCIF